MGFARCGRIFIQARSMNPGPNTQNQRPNPPQAGGIALADVYHVLFKHKWMILLFSLAGLGAAGVIYFRMAPPYQSEAKLLVRYVQDSKSVAPTGDSQIKPADLRGEGIISSEAEILTSLDIAGKVVDAIGVEKILGKESGQTNRDVAAIVLKKNLIAEVPKRGNVLRIVYQHPDPAVAQPVLRQVIDTYFKKHVEVHRALGVYDEFLQQQTDAVRANLAVTEEELRKLKAKANVVSLDETKKVYADHFARLRQELFNAEVELAERQAALKELKKLAPEAVGAAPAAKEGDPEPARMPTLEQLQEYKRLHERLEALWKREQELLTHLTTENALVKEVQKSLADLQSQKAKLESETPGLLESQPAVASAGESTARNGFDVNSEMVRVTALTARIGQLTSQYDKIKGEALAVDDAEAAIVQLQRKKELEESQFRYYSSRLEEARLDSTLAAGKISNISEIQAPSPPTRDGSGLKKKLLMAIGGGIGVGLALAFLLELVLNQKVRRPGDIRTQFHLPLLLTIPDFGRNGHRRRLPGGKGQAKFLTNGEGSTENAVAKKNGHQADIAPWDENHQLYPFSEALRDRLVNFFEVRGMTHKPKLIAITACDRGAGVTSIASGLAASLSETGEGNVLLVDMNLERGAAHPFYKGKPACGLEEALTQGKREAALVQEKLYVVNGNQADDRLPRILPKRFAHLVPQLQASDYDYIIFDMAPVTQTSVTARIASMMDIVLMVVADNNTNREVMKQASSLLAETKANVGVVFNRRRTYVPRWLLQEF